MGWYPEHLCHGLPELTPEIFDQYRERGWIVIENALGDYTQQMVKISKQYQDWYLAGVGVDPLIKETWRNLQTAPYSWRQPGTGWIKYMYCSPPQVVLAIDPGIQSIVAALTGITHLYMNFYEGKVHPPCGSAID